VTTSRLEAFCLGTACLVLSVAAAAGDALGQSSSLYGDPQVRRTLSMAESSWTYEAPQKPKVIEVNDLITIVVKEAATMTSKGEMDRRKKATVDAALTNWVLLDKLALVPDPQTRGDPKLSASLDNKLRSQADLQTRDTLQFKIGVRVADRRPNGLLVVEGRRHIEINHETWEYCLTGIVRPQDVLPNNSVLSENVADLRIFKAESGHVRDGYRRGWLLRYLDKYQPF
jgi:flagellar L-ring protein FlgH